MGDQKDHYGGEQGKFAYMPYEKGTLILFCHGFSPLEREFLLEAGRCAGTGNAGYGAVPWNRKGQENVQPGEYYHTGDLDYGGVRIFQAYPGTRISKITATFHGRSTVSDRYLDYGTDMEPSSWEKLKNVEEPLLQQLIDRILTTKKVIEQEEIPDKSE